MAGTSAAAAGERMTCGVRPSGMTALRAALLAAAFLLALAAPVIYFVHVRESIPGMHCMAYGPNGPVCPAARYVRHTGLATGAALLALLLVGGAAFLPRRRRNRG
ncbi:hypothetical protein KDK95_17280 [Actinospica sp. MGRD01-02]|uniref:Uncharacterized protein n=1 Tax=Actinospica acidithermotolerans TaxID=2828514 RepID=A0A941IKF7_9ACTN|nr:hypothetical protein [Actinospica acidithermotolerans]MBR7828073.1 hypothetical protein [Actinospica acidithermotolerans]